MSAGFYTSIAPYYDEIFPLPKPMIEFVHRRTNTSVNVLDVGCATGQLAAVLAPKSKSVFALDHDEEMIANAQQRLGRMANVSVRKADMLNISDEFGFKKFELVTCVGNTLVHLPDEKSIAEFIKQAYGLLQFGGIFIIQILNYQHIVENSLTQLPLIDNDRVRFVREYDFLENGYLRFNTKLHIKQSEKVISNSSILLCLPPKRLYQILRRAGFYHIYPYESWSEDRVSNNALPLIVEAIKT